MFNENTLFELLSDEVSERTGLAPAEIHLNSLIVDDLDLEDEDLDAILADIQSTLLSDEDLIGSNLIRNCRTVSDLVDVLMEL